MPKYGSKMIHRVFGEDPVHLTYRLFGSIPKKEMKAISAERNRLLVQLNELMSSMDRGSWKAYQDQQIESIDEKFEMAIDEALHATATGPFYLQQPALAKEVLDSWKFLHERKTVFIFAICVMSNHVHVILKGPLGQPPAPPGPVMEAHKKFTSRVCNKILGTTGVPFWEPIYFDRNIREGKFMKTMWYLLNNPWQAGICKDWQEYPHIWVNPEYIDLFR